MDCGNRAFKAGLRYCGLPGADVPELKETDDIKAFAERYGLRFVWKGEPLREGNNPVLVVYLDKGEGTDGEYHAVFASDQAPFVRWNVHSAIVGWEELRQRVERIGSSASPAVVATGQTVDSYRVTITLEQEAETEDEAWESTLNDLASMSSEDLRTYAEISCTGTVEP